MINEQNISEQELTNFFIMDLGLRPTEVPIFRKLYGGQQAKQDPGIASISLASHNSTLRTYIMHMRRSIQPHGLSIVLNDAWIYELPKECKAKINEDILAKRSRQLAIEPVTIPPDFLGLKHVEGKILEHFINNSSVCSHRNICEGLLKKGCEISEKSVRTYITRMRRKLPKGVFIRTLNAFGYELPNPGKAQILDLLFSWKAAGQENVLPQKKEGISRADVDLILPSERCMEAIAL